MISPEILELIGRYGGVAVATLAILGFFLAMYLKYGEDSRIYRPVDRTPLRKCEKKLIRAKLAALDEREFLIAAKIRDVIREIHDIQDAKRGGYMPGKEKDNDKSGQA